MSSAKLSYVDIIIGMADFKNYSQGTTHVIQSSPSIMNLSLYAKKLANLYLISIYFKSIPVLMPLKDFYSRSYLTGVSH